MKSQLTALAGPPCSGKSTAGTILAELLSVRFCETDRMVESSLGKPISWIFHNLGEKAFRTAEKQAVEKALAHEPCVIALGGGTLLNTCTRKLVESRCRLFTLWASPETLARRNTGERPLAASNCMFQALLLERRKHYESLPGRVSTEGRTPRMVAELIAELLRKEDPVLWSR